MGNRVLARWETVSHCRGGKPVDEDLSERISRGGETEVGLMVSGRQCHRGPWCEAPRDGSRGVD